MSERNAPVGYRVQTHVACCANCRFGGYLGRSAEHHRMVPCEIHGEPEDGDYAAIAVEPLGICDAWKQGPYVEPRGSR